MPDAPYFPEGMPLPQPEPLTEEFWAGGAAKELRIQRCEACGTHRHPPAVVCRRCHSFDYGWDVSRGSGRVFSFTVVHHSVHPSTTDRVPYNVAVVELDDCSGVMVTSNVVDCTNEELHVGMPVALVWEAVDDGLFLYRFGPQEGA